MKNPLRRIVENSTIAEFREKRRLPSRRQVLSLVTGSAIGFAASEAVSRGAIDPMLEEDRQTRRRCIYQPIMVERFDEIATPEMRSALAAWREGSDDLAPAVLTKTTMTYEGNDGRRRIKIQGEENGKRLFGRPMPPETLMIEQDDPAFGIFAEERMTLAALAREPHLSICRYEKPSGDLLKYFALALPYPDGRVLSVTRPVG